MVEKMFVIGFCCAGLIGCIFGWCACKAMGQAMKKGTHKNKRRQLMCEEDINEREEDIDDEDEGMSIKALEYEPIQIMENEVKSLKGKWLRKYGWEESCDFVDSNWRWVKQIGDVLYMCDMGEAINIEYNFLEEEKNQ